MHAQMITMILGQHHGQQIVQDFQAPIVSVLMEVILTLPLAIHPFQNQDSALFVSAPYFL